MATTDTQTTVEELLEVVFSLLCAKTVYNKNQLPLQKSPEMAVKSVGSCVWWFPAWEDMSLGAEEHSLLEDITKQCNEDRDW
jgi:hypothetical protein